MVVIVVCGRGVGNKMLQNYSLLIANKAQWEIFAFKICNCWHRMFVRIFLVLITKISTHWNFGNLEWKHMLSSLLSSMSVHWMVMLQYVGRVFSQPRVFPVVYISNLFVLYLEERERERFGHKENSILQKCLIRFWGGVYKLRGCTKPVLKLKNLYLFNCGVKRCYYHMKSTVMPWLAW